MSACLSTSFPRRRLHPNGAFSHLGFPRTELFFTGGSHRQEDRKINRYTGIRYIGIGKNGINKGSVCSFSGGTKVHIYNNRNVPDNRPFPGDVPNPLFYLNGMLPPLSVSSSRRRHRSSIRILLLLLLPDLLSCDGRGIRHDTLTPSPDRHHDDRSTILSFLNPPLEVRVSTTFNGRPEKH